MCATASFKMYLTVDKGATQRFTCNNLFEGLLFPKSWARLLRARSRHYEPSTSAFDTHLFISHVSFSPEEKR